MWISKKELFYLNEKIASKGLKILNLQGKTDLQESIIKDIIEYLDIEYSVNQKIKFVRREHDENR